MSDIWWFAPCPSDEPGLDRLVGHCRFMNGEEVNRAGSRPHELPSSDSKIARLDLTLENFSLDCFYWVDCLSFQPFMFVSQELRDAMALGPRDVQYLPVDASRSAPLPRSKNYMIMHVPAVEDISSRYESIYHDTAGIPEVPIMIGRIAIRYDANPQHDIFRDSFFPGFVFCTDELAVRVLQRQCSGIRFIDPWDFDDPLRFRSLRGIEKESWSAKQKKPDPGPVDGNSNTHTGNNGIYADYGNHIRGVHFAAVKVPLGSVGPTKLRADFERLADGSIRSDTDEIITSPQLLSALDQSKERDAVWSAITKFELDPKQAGDILAARAYVWANSFAPWNFADVPPDGPVLEFVSAQIMQIERTRPGTLYLALQGDRPSVSRIRLFAEGGLIDAMEAGN